ncbi:MAG: Hsp20/alpha crystallin family protein [Terrimicrobiaceae bacterium]
MNTNQKLYATAWSPLYRLAPWRDLLESRLGLNDTAGPTGWRPPLDVYEDTENVTVTVELAGLKKEDFEISLEDDTLTVSGKRTTETQETRGECFRSERVFGAFQRSVSLPAPVNPDGVTAGYQDGVLTVTLPKAEEAKPRKIEVQLK